MRSTVQIILRQQVINRHHPLTQCAAVITYRSLIRVPPQQNLLKQDNRTIHGNSLGSLGLPPTIRVSSFATPQADPKNENIFKTRVMVTTTYQRRANWTLKYANTKPVLDVEFFFSFHEYIIYFDRVPRVLSSFFGRLICSGIENVFQGIYTYERLSAVNLFRVVMSISARAFRIAVYVLHSQRLVRCESAVGSGVE